MSKRLELKQTIQDVKAADANVSKAIEVYDRCQAEIASVEAALADLRQRESIRARTRLARLQRAEQQGEAEATDEPNDAGRHILELEAELHNQKLTLAYAEAEFKNAKGALDDAATRRHDAALAVINEDVAHLITEARRQEEIAAEYRRILLSLDTAYVPTPDQGLQRIGQRMGPHLFEFFHDVSPFLRAAQHTGLMDAWSGYFQRLLECADAEPVSVSGRQKQTPENSQSKAA